MFLFRVPVLPPCLALCINFVQIRQTFKNQDGHNLMSTLNITEYYD